MKGYTDCSDIHAVTWNIYIFHAFTALFKRVLRSVSFRFSLELS